MPNFPPRLLQATPTTTGAARQAGGAGRSPAPRRRARARRLLLVPLLSVGAVFAVVAGLVVTGLTSANGDRQRDAGSYKCGHAGGLAPLTAAVPGRGRSGGHLATASQFWSAADHRR